MSLRAACDRATPYNDGRFYIKNKAYEQEEYRMFIYEDRNSSMERRVLHNKAVMRFEESTEEAGSFRIVSNKYPSLRFASGKEGQTFAYGGAMWGDQLYSF